MAASEYQRPPALRHISRVDSGHTHAWWVRIYAGGKVLATKIFSDGQHGSRESALKAAQKWRDSQVKKFAKQLQRTPHDRRHRTTAAKSLSGIRGVSPEINGRLQTPAVAAWKALWSDAEGKAARERFSVAELGYEAALQKAVVRRFKEIGQPVPKDLKMPSERAIMKKWRAR